MSASVMAAVNSNLDEPICSIRYLAVGYTSVVETVAVGSGGSGYSVGDELLILQTGASQGATVKVTSVGGGGAVTGISLIQNGVGYTSASGLSTQETGTGTGTGCTVNITAGSASQLLDVGLAFNQAAQGVLANVTVNQV